MGMAGAITPTGGAPRPDPERVATIRYTLVDEPETCAAFAEPIRARLAALNERVVTEAQDSDLNAASLLLDHVRDRVGGLNPAQLEPRKGLAGLFDSRSKRLKAFRGTYTSAAAEIANSATELSDRTGALARRSASLEGLWGETREAITELDAHIAAARGWLASDEIGAEADLASAVSGSVATIPTEPEADPVAEVIETVEAVAELEPDPVLKTEPPVAETVSVPADTDSLRPDTVAALPHPLETRLATLDAVRAVAIGRLPLIRAAQNAEHTVPPVLKQACDAIEGWRADWLDALGLAGKKKRKSVRPDRVRLTEASSTLTSRIEATARELATATARRKELGQRLTAARPIKVLKAA